MITVLITACGGPSSLSFSRSLRDADPDGNKYKLIGTDCDKFNIHRAECDEVYLCPKANDPLYIPFIINLIEDKAVDILHSQPEVEAYIIGKNRERITRTGCKLFMPDQDIIELFRDKASSYHLWKKAGIKVPENIELNNENDLKIAFDKFGSDIWIRETIGAAGKGALSRPNYETALNHLNSNNSWGCSVAAEHLTSKTITWQSIWYQGDLIVAQGRERLYWAFGNRAQSGVTGLTGTGVTVSDSELDNLSQQCILSATKKPHGIFSVDFTYDNSGVPNPTEINIAKFFTTHHFITKTGCNMPEIFIDLALGKFEGVKDKLNPCEDDMCWIRGIDIEPILLPMKEINNKVEQYKKTISSLQPLP